MADMEERRIKLRVIKADLPDDINGACQDRGEGSYIIFINRSLDDQRQSEAFIHEVLHVWNDDFNNRAPVGEVEKNTHRRARELCRIN